MHEGQNTELQMAGKDLIGTVPKTPAKTAPADVNAIVDARIEEVIIAGLKHQDSSPSTAVFSPKYLCKSANSARI